MQKRDLRKKCSVNTRLVADKASNTKGFMNCSRSVALFDPLTRGLKVGTNGLNPYFWRICT